MILTINNLKRNTADDVVTTAHWNASLTDGDYSASAYGSVSFTRDEESPDFIAFEDLTEADVVGWVKESMMSTRDVPAVMDEDGNETSPATTETIDGVAELEANLQAQIDEQKTPTTVSGIPWQEDLTEAV